MLLLPVAFSYGCSDAPTSPTARAGVTPHALLAPVVTVTNTDDAGAGSLRQAIADAAAGSVIQFDATIAGQTIVLSTGHLDVNKSLTIEGPVPAGMTISAGLTSQVFVVRSGDVVLRNLSIVNGRADVGGGLTISGKATLDHVLVANNEATDFGGGGIFVSDPSAELTLVNSTVSGNATSGSGGGLWSVGAVSIRNTTISHNTAGSGGGVWLFGGSFSLRNSIIADNVAGGPSYSNCLINTSGVVLLYTGLNISNDDSCGSTSPALRIADPKLDLLANNGGPTKTHALGPESAAIDVGLSCTEATDQRYVARPQGLTCDVGAVEFNDYGTFTLTIGPNVAVNARTGVVTLTGTVVCSRPTLIARLDVEMSQTQKTTGRFTAIVKATGIISNSDCQTSPSSWSVALAPQSPAKFEPGAATGTATTISFGGQFLPATVTSTLKVFQVK